MASGMVSGTGTALAMFTSGSLCAQCKEAAYLILENYFRVLRNSSVLPHVARNHGVPGLPRSLVSYLS